MRTKLPLALLALAIPACAGDPTHVQVELSPAVISSLDGTTTVSALVSDDQAPLPDQPVRVTIVYSDRNGTPHEIPQLDGKTDERGVFEGVVAGLDWDGTGTITVETTDQLAASATFAVLDRTPPTIEILPPTTDGRVGPGLPVDVLVHVTDEIGIAEVTIDGVGTNFGSRTRTLASGALDTTLVFRASIPAGAQPGPNVKLNALVRDLSGNIAAAATVTLEVDPAITVATPPGFTGSLLVDGSAQELVDPRSVVVSAKDGHLYVADQAGVGACNPSCIWRVDPVTATIDPTPVVVGIGDIEGVALDATSDNLFFTDRSNRVRRLTWDGTAYTGAVQCVDAAQQRPQDPMHLVFDPTLGILTPDDNAGEVIQIATCTAASVGTELSNNANLDAPHGIALGPAGEIYVSDSNDDVIVRIDRTTGDRSVFSTSVNAPRGLEWVGGASSFADSLLVASSDTRTVESTKGIGAIAAVYLRNPPIDLALAGDTLYVVTSPAFGNRGRIYKVTGY